MKLLLETNKLVFKSAVNYCLQFSSVFLFLLLIFVPAVSFLRVENIRKTIPIIQNENTEILVTNIEKDSFNQTIYYGIIPKKSLLETYILQPMKTNKNNPQLVIGNYYSVNGKIKPFEFDFNDKNLRFGNYNLAQNIKGQFEYINFTEIGCGDIICTVIKQSFLAKNNLSYLTYQNHCHNAVNIQINNTLGLDPITACKDISLVSNALIIGVNKSSSDKFSSSLSGNIKSNGLSHIFSFSGFQISILFAFLEWVLNSKLGVSGNTRFIFLIIFFCLTLFFIGFLAPVIRTVFSVIISISVLYFTGRKISPLRSIIYSGLLMLILNPFYLYNISFQLSIFSTIGVILAASFKFNFPIKKINLVLEILLQTIFATIFTLPIVLVFENNNTAIAFLVNSILLPFIPLLSLLGIFGWIPGVGGFFSIFQNFFIGLILLFLQYLNELKFFELNYLIFVQNMYFKIIYYALICYVILFFININPSYRLLDKKDKL